MSRYSAAVESKDKKPRKCLKCNKEFESSWKGHRICRRCSNTGDREGHGIATLKIKGIARSED